MCHLDILAFDTMEQKLLHFRCNCSEFLKKKSSICSRNQEQSSHKSLCFMQMTFCESLYYKVMLVRYILNKLSVEAAENIEIFFNDWPTCILN